MSAFGGPNIVDNGLVLYLDAGNRKSYTSGSTTWFDKSGFNNNGTLTNGPTFNTGSGGSIVFDGTNDYVLCSTLSSSINPNNGITLNYFVKTSNTSRRNLLVSNYSIINPYPGITGELGTVGGGLWQNGLRWQVIGNGRIDIYVNNVIQNNTVYFVTFTFDFASKSAKIHLNGVELVPIFRASSSNITTDWLQNVNLQIAADAGNSLFYLGDIYNISIYNRALSAQEILQNYNATKGRFGL